MKGISTCTISWNGSVYFIKADPRDTGILLSGRRYELNGEKTRFVQSSDCLIAGLAEPPSTATATGERGARSVNDNGRLSDGPRPGSNVALSIRCEHCREVSVIGCDIVVDVTLGLRYPCVVLKSRHLNQGMPEWFTVYLIQLRDGYFVIAGKVTSLSLKESGVSWKLFGDDQNLSVTDGPGFCYCEDRLVYVAMCVDHQQQKIETGTFELSVSVSDSSETVPVAEGPEQWNTTITVLETMLLPKNEIVLLLTSNRKVTAVKLTFPTHSIGLTHTKVQFLDETDFIPQLYSTIVDKVLLQKFHIRSILHGFRDTMQLLENTLFVFTRQGQLLQLSNGSLISCVNVDISGNIQKMITFKGPTELYVVLLDKEHNVYIISTCSFKVKKTFSGVYDIFADDVLHEGSDQLLMIQEESSIDPSAWHRFTITNLYASHFSSCHPKENADSSDPECRDDKLKIAVKALQGRLQAGLTHLSRVQRELYQKNMVVEQVTESIRQMSLGLGKIKPQAGLHSLLGESTSSDPFGGGDCGKSSVDQVTAVGTNCSVVAVTSVWQRVVEREHWVVATNVTNSSQECLRNMSAFIVLDSRVEKMETFCKFHLTNADGSVQQGQHSSASCEQTVNQASLTQPRPKKARFLVASKPCSHAPNNDLPPGGSGILLVVTKIPDFNCSSKVKATIVLVWSKDCQSLQQRMSESSMLPTLGDYGKMRRNVCEMPAGTVILHASDIIKEIFKVKTYIQEGQYSEMYLMCNRLALDATQLCTILNLHSTYTDLSHFEDSTVKELGFQWSESYKCYLAPSDGQLSQIRLQPYPMKQKGSRLLNVFSRDEAELFLFIHAVYSIVADDVILLPYHPTDPSASVTSTLHAMQQEVATSVSTLKAMLESSVAPHPEQEMPSNNQLKAETAQKIFISRKRQLHERSHRDEVITENFEKHGYLRSQLEHVTDVRVKHLSSDIPGVFMKTKKP